jgi:hypothetical protein
MLENTSGGIFDPGSYELDVVTEYIAVAKEDPRLLDAIIILL